MSLIDTFVLPASLWLIMFSIGLSLTPDDFRRVFTQRRALVAGIASMLVVPPLVGVAMAVTFAPSPALAVGFVLLATCPGGMLSNLMTDLAKGDLALSLSLSIVVSMVYIVVVPFYAHFALLHFMGMEASVEIPLVAFIWKIFSITLVPASLGLLARMWKPGPALAARTPVKAVAMAALLVAFGFILADQIPVLRENFETLFWMTLGINAVTLALVMSLTKVLALAPGEKIAVGIEHLIRQEGTAIYIAVTIVGSREMSLPMIMNTPVGLVVCILFVLVSRRIMARRSAPAHLGVAP